MMEELINKYKSIIKAYEVTAWDSEPTSYRYKAKLALIDDSHLVIKDYLFSSERKYTFHWQDKNGDLIMRWDNAGHWNEIDTFPHHRHEKDGVFSSREVTMEDVLHYISIIIGT